MKNKETSSNVENIQERTFTFAGRIVRLYQYLMKRDRMNDALCRQIVRSGTSIGANLEEANAAQSRADFMSKCHIALKEARETYYWLRLMNSVEMISPDQLKDLIQESNEIVAILTSIVKNSKLNKD